MRPHPPIPLRLSRLLARLACASLYWGSKALLLTPRTSHHQVEWPERSVLALSQLAWTQMMAVAIPDGASAAAQVGMPTPLCLAKALPAVW